MGLVSIGDMAQSFQMRRYNTQLKTEMTRLATELTTGRTSNLAKTVSGEFSLIAGIERSLAKFGAFKTATSEAGIYASTIQLSLDSIQNSAMDVGPNLVNAGNSGNATFVAASAAEARQKLASVISALNVNVSGRNVFSGMATDRAAMPSAEQMISELKAFVATDTTATEVKSSLDTWFAAGGDFETGFYQGSNRTLNPIEIGEGKHADLDVTAQDPALRDVLKGLAMAALIAEGVLSGETEERAILLKSAGEITITGETKISGLRARIGSIEGHIEEATVSNATEVSALELVRANVTSIDPYQAATELEATQSQLETMYTLTARLSRLSLADFLR